MITRHDNRAARQLREVRFAPAVNPYAEGSVQVSFGATTLLVTATIEQETPKWMPEGSGGWITAEYGMLPRATHTRSRREASSGKQGGRTLEIQRLIGRALRAAVDLKQLPGLTITLDCDVIVADGGTRTAAISGGWIALYQALRWAGSRGMVDPQLAIAQIAAVSVGMCSGTLLVDLCYEEDSAAEFDANLVFNERGDIIELQGTAERAALPPGRLGELIELGAAAASQLMAAQRDALRQIGS